MKRTSWLWLAIAIVGMLGSAVGAQAYTFSGTVTAPDGMSSEIIVGASIVVEPGNHTATTGADGKFSIGGLAGGTYTVTVDAPGRLGYVMDLKLESDKHCVFSLAPDVSEQPGQSPTGTVFGAVPGGSPIPLPNALIRVTPGNFTTYTDVNGNFTLPGTIGPGTFMIHVSASGYKPQNDHRTLPAAGPLVYTLEPTGKLK